MEVKSIYPIINFSDEDEIAVQYERLGADGVIIISPDFSDEAMLIKKIRNICEKSDCRLYIWQPYRRLEDIKKVLYAGAAGAWIGMQTFRHKTKHMSFRMLVPLFAVVHMWMIVRYTNLI